MNFFITRQIPNYPLLTLKQIIRLGCKLKANNNLHSNITLISSTRSAIKIWIQENLDEDDQIYIPSYICADVTIPLTEDGRLITYYPCKENLEPDWEWLENNITSDCKALLLVHYFGFPNNIDHALTFSRKHNIILLEDCAHSFLTRVGDKIIGTFGEAGFYSYHKLLPIPEGAGIYDQRTRETTLKKYFLLNTQVSPLVWPKRLMIMIMYTLHMPPLIWSLLASSYNQLMPSETSEPPSPMSKLSRKILYSYENNFDDLIESRRYNYELLVNELKDIEGCTLLFPNLEKGICPYALPLLVENSDEYISLLNKQGVPAQKWPDLPEAVINDAICSVSINYVKRLILLPIHQTLNTNAIYKIANAFKSANQSIVRR